MSGGGRATRDPWSRAVRLALAVPACAAVAWADWATGAEINFTLGYVFPVAFATWRGSRAAGTAAAVLCGSLSVAVDLALGRYRAEPLHLVWNGSVILALFGLVVFVVDRLHRGYVAEHALHRQVEEAYDRLDDEMRVVGRIQRSLLPPAPPAVPGYGIAVHYATSARAGGDYYDFFEEGDGRVGVLVADVSGHGPAAAVIMAMVRELVHGDAGARASPAGLLAAANRRLFEDILEGHFVTACHGILDPGSGRFAYSLAGHPSPILARAGGPAAELGGRPGRPLGMEEGTEYATQEAVLGPGDVLLLYSDGLTEAHGGGGALLGEEAVCARLAAASAEDAPAIVARLVDAMHAHCGLVPAADDVTVVVVKREPGPAGPRGRPS